MTNQINSKSDISYFKFLLISITERQTFSFLLFLLLFVIGCVSISIVSTWQHENVHKAINTQYGLDSKFGWKIKGLIITASTTAIVPENYSYSNFCNETCKMLHMQNEIITYNLDAIMNLVSLMLFLCVCYYHIRNFNNNRFDEYINEKIIKKNEQEIINNNTISNNGL